MTDVRTDEVPAVAGSDGRGDGGPGGGAPTARRRRRGRWVVRGVLLAILVVVGYVGITFVQVWQASRRDGAREAGAIVVLGAAQYDGLNSP